MNRLNEKTEYIVTLAESFELAEKLASGSEGKGDTYFTYFTPGFTITGKLSKIENFKAEDMESLEIELAEKLKNGSLSTFALTNKMLEFRKNNFLSDENTEVYEEDKKIVLEDVIIKDSKDFSYSTPRFVLFTDQVIGIIPAVR